MKLARVYGISPDDAALLEAERVCTTQDLADSKNLTDLSLRTKISILKLREWQAWADSAIVGGTWRRNARRLLVAWTVLPLLGIGVWFTAQSISPNLDRAIHYYNRGNTALNAGDYSSAIGDYRRAIALQPNLAAPYNNMGVALQRRSIQGQPIELAGESDKMLDASLQSALSIDPNFPVGLYNLAASFVTNREYDSAIALYKRAIASDPKLAKAHTNLAYCLLMKGESAEGIKELHKALHLDQNDYVAHTSLGWALGRDGDVDGEISEYQKAILIAPEWETAHYDLGDAFQKEGRLNEAIEAYHSALAINPEDVAAHIALGAALHAGGDLDGALQEQRIALSLQGPCTVPDLTCSLAHYNSGAVLVAKGKIDGAIREWEAASAIDPKWIQPYLGLADMYERQGQIKKAIEAYKNALKLNPNDKVALNALASLEPTSHN